MKTKRKSMHNVAIGPRGYAVWNDDVSECDECLAGEEVCPEHNLDDETVALGYSYPGDQ